MRVCIHVSENIGKRETGTRRICRLNKQSIRFKHVVEGGKTPAKRPLILLQTMMTMMTMTMTMTMMMMMMVMMVMMMTMMMMMMMMVYDGI